MALWCGVVVICSVVVNVALKYLANQALPGRLVARPCGKQRVCGTWGMPSGHAQTMGLVASYLTLLAVHGGKVSWTPGLVLLWILTVAVCWQRWQTARHTGPQVGVGFVVGCLIGLVSFALTVRRPRGASALD